MEALANKLLETDVDACMADLMDIVGVDNAGDYKEKLERMMETIDTELLKKIAIKFSGYREFLGYEDVLCGAMGDDAFFDWADDNGVK